MLSNLFSSKNVRFESESCIQNCTKCVITSLIIKYNDNVACIQDSSNNILASCLS
jgi:hypothetical protein